MATRTTWATWATRGAARAAVVTVAAAGVVLVGACGGADEQVGTGASRGELGDVGPSPTAPPDGAPAGGPGSDAASGPPTTEPPPGATVPPAPSPTPLPTVASGSLDCGTVRLASGWPTTFPPSPAPYECLHRAFVAAEPAQLVVRSQTDGQGGAVVVTTYVVRADGTVEVIEDASEAADRPQVVTRSVCRTLEPSTGPDVAVGDCTPPG